MNGRTAGFLSPARLARVQGERWSKQAAYVVKASPFYRRLWDGRHPPRSLDAVAYLPFTTKTVLRDNQAAAAPFVDYLAAPETKVVRLQRTSGTTGLAMTLALSAADAAQTAKVGAHTLAGLLWGTGPLGSDIFFRNRPTASVPPPRPPVSPMNAPGTCA